MNDSPYPGLRPFGRDESRIFFGRNEHIDQLLEKLGRTRFVAVFGPSGFGKSSLVRAGLFGSLEAGFLETSGRDNWRIAEMRPGNHPFARLASALCRESVLDIGSSSFAGLAQDDITGYVQGRLRQGPLGLKEVVDVCPLPDDTNLLVLVDQFEEIFRYHHDGNLDETTAFVSLLLESANQADWPIYIVLTMRSDFLGDCTLFLDLPEAINEGQFLTPRLTRDQLQEAIEKPARLYNVEIEPGVVNRLLNDAGTHPDQLPLMQHVLMRMWRRAPAHGERKVLTLTDYEEMGGFDQVLSEHADEALAELLPPQLAIAEHLFRALCERGSDQRDTRHPMRFENVRLITETSEAELKSVVETFREPERSFIIPPRPHPIDSHTVLDISHESLIRQWQRLQDWVEAEAQSAEMYRRLEETARLWERGSAGLWGSPDLDYALQWREDERPNEAWAKRYGDHFDLAMQFLEESIASQEVQQRAEAEARQREAEAEQSQRELERIRRERFYGRVILSVVTLALFVTVGLAMLAVRESKNAEVAQLELESSLETTEKALVETQKAKDKAEKALGHAWVAQHQHAAVVARAEDYAEAMEVLQQARQLDSEELIAHYPTHKLLTRFGEMMGAEARYVYQVARVPLFSVAVSGDGNLLAAAGENGTVLLFDVEKGDFPQQLPGHNKIHHVSDIVFDPKGKWLASAGLDRLIIKWSLSPDGKASKPQSWKSDVGITALAVSPDGQLLASGGTDGGIRLLDAEDGDSVDSLEGHAGQISEFTGIDFSPSGKLLASGSHDRTARVWDVATGESQVLKWHSGIVQGVSFSPDEKRIATSSADKTVALWEIGSEDPPQVFKGHQSRVVGVHFVKNHLQMDREAATANHHVEAPLLVTASLDSTLRVWDIESGVTLRVLQGHTADVWEVATQTSTGRGYGAEVFSASKDGTVRRWRITPLPYQTLVGLPDLASSVAIAPSGEYVAVGFESGALHLYSLPNLSLVAELDDAHDTVIARLAFSSDGDLLASASYDSEAKLWSTVVDGSLTKVQTFKDHESAINGLAFSPDDKFLVTASEDGRIGRFTVGTKERLFIEDHQGDVASVAFDDKGRLLSAGFEDKTLRLWDLAANPPRQIQVFPESQDRLLWATLSPDGKVVASVGENGLAQVYFPDNPQRKYRLVGHRNTIYRAIFSPTGHQLATVSADDTLRLWDVETGKELFRLHLPTPHWFEDDDPFLDFDFRCTPTGCWIAVPFTLGKLALYEFGNIYD